MTHVDLIIAALMALGAVRGFFTGLIRQVVGLAGLIVGFVLAIELMSYVGRYVASPLGFGSTSSNVVGFLVTFVTVQVLVAIVTRLSEAATGALRLTLLNRTGGAIFGGLKTILLVSIALVLLGRLGIPSTEDQRESILYGSVALLVPSAWDLAADVWPRVRSLSARFGDEVRSHGSRPAATEKADP